MTDNHDVLPPKLFDQIKERVTKGAQKRGLTVEQTWRNFVLKERDDFVDYILVFVLVDMLGYDKILSEKILWREGDNIALSPIDLVVASNRINAARAFMIMKLYSKENNFDHVHRLILGAKKVGHDQMAELLLKCAQHDHPEHFKV